ncbi:transcription factor Sox-1b isoform X2 [Halyomorpha halys]|uniref:transcription factor Sox-1b isoform X2 n=1 Tax=Halyomorpha halys TaxID=286706 RepID=UPI0006D52747
MEIRVSNESVIPEHLSSNKEDNYHDLVKKEDNNENGKAGPSCAKVISVNDITGQTNGIRLVKSNIKIPRPPNAFMIYANTWRKKLAHDHPSESNKQISVRLGKLWKDMAADEKELYFTLARRVDAEHKKKYPDYVYNPKEARLRKALRDRGRLQRPKPRWTTAGEATPVLLPIMLSRRVEAHSPTMLQSYNEGYPDLSYGQHLQMAPPSEYHHVHSWYNNYIHGGSEHQNGGIDYLNRGEEKHAPDWGYRPDSTMEPDSSYQTPPDSGYTGQQVGPIIPQMPIDSPMMGQVMQEPIILPPESHNGAVSLIQNGTDRSEPQPRKEEGDSLPKLNGPQAMPVEKKDVLKLPGFHQTFGNITEIGRFSQPDEFFESRPPEILDPPPKENVSKFQETKKSVRPPLFVYDWRMSDPVGLQQQENLNDDYSSISDHCDTTSTPKETLDSPQNFRKESCQNQKIVCKSLVSQTLSHQHRTYFIQGSNSFLKRGDVT